MALGESVPRIDAYEKVTGRAKYTGDLVDRNALTAKILHSSIANGLVTKIDVSAAEKISGVVKIVTCFDVPDIAFPTAGHPWSLDPGHRDPADRKLLNRRVRLFGDDIAAVIADDGIAANRALRAIRVEYDEYPPVLDPEKAAAEGVSQLHEGTVKNILGTSSFDDGDFEGAVAEPGLRVFRGVYETPIVQHCHIEPAVSFAWMEGGRIVVVSSTQIPHIVRRIVGQALGIPWGRVRIIKPYLGGGFGNKQDALTEPLNAYLTTVAGGRCVKLELSREEIFADTRTRHAEKFYLSAWVRPNGRLVARSYTAWSNQGAYGSHGHSIAAKGTNTFRQLYRDEKASRVRAYTVYTNVATAGAMRGYGTPQANFAVESQIEDIAYALKMDPLEFRLLNVMPVGYQDPFSKNVNYFDSFRQCAEQCRQTIDWDAKRVRYVRQSGPVRRGVGMAFIWYNTAVWPISLEISSCRMVLNQDGSVQVQLAETEIGQGADTAFAQMTADALGIDYRDVHVVSTQDTDITPFGTGAYASRQTYLGGMAIKQTAALLKEKIIAAAMEILKAPEAELDLRDGCVCAAGTEIGLSCHDRLPLPLGDLAAARLYSTDHAEHLTAESSAQAKSNAYSFGCCMAEVEVDIPLGKVKLLNMVNAHDCGRLINPCLAEAQVHGGMSMGIGYGLSEQMLYDEKTGELLNGNFLDYKLATIMDTPHLEARFVENPEPTGAFGTKALGEPPAVPGAAAIRNAVLHATGVGVNKIPLTPHVLIPAFKAAGLMDTSKGFTFLKRPDLNHLCDMQTRSTSENPTGVFRSAPV
ncbi:MAG: xanthine dehydrogenase molybdenum-binding subunit XdhA [Spirochaetaceae bacterium]|jgi:xanthine dehydrogenase molybdenum-binding subunit|nr:xanthine dehydrogenase molybdenum-binding subunit XdhA [Spirochaetaceae bacterium]